ncbi:MAG: zinc-binding alcohol dehydrogenase [Chloroflexi bacterium]|nr:zinc-binding alcohol dehydrogenase [Chloroflexota bacterium]
MKIPILHGPRDLRIEEQPLDTSNLQPHDVWVETIISAFKIGTDRGNYEGAEQVPGAPDYPRPVGDSSYGVVRGLGSAVTRLKVGDRVVSSNWHQSEYIFDERGSIARVPEGVDPENAVYTQLYTLSGHCYRKALFQPGENVAVVGLGVLGLGAVALGPLLGARVVGLGNSPVRLEMAQKMGAHATFLSSDPDLAAKLDDFTNGAGIDLVILTANPWPAFRTSMEVVRPDGRVSIVSLLGRGEPPLDFNPLPMEWFYSKGISLIAVSGRSGYLYPSSREADRFSWNRASEFTLSLMVPDKQTGKAPLRPKELITHRMPFTEMVQAYEMAYHREKNMLGVIFQWQNVK